MAAIHCTPFVHSCNGRSARRISTFDNTIPYPEKGYTISAYVIRVTARILLLPSQKTECRLTHGLTANWSNSFRGTTWAVLRVR
jgi:hypothetical protein